MSGPLPAAQWHIQRRASPLDGSGFRLRLVLISGKVGKRRNGMPSRYNAPNPITGHTLSMWSHENTHPSCCFFRDFLTRLSRRNGLRGRPVAAVRGRVRVRIYRDQLCLRRCDLIDWFFFLLGPHCHGPHPLQTSCVALVSVLAAPRPTLVPCCRLLRPTALSRLAVLFACAGLRHAREAPPSFLSATRCACRAHLRPLAPCSMWPFSVVPTEPPQCGLCVRGRRTRDAAIVVARVARTRL